MLRDGLLNEQTTVFDYGCGHGIDIELLSDPAPTAPAESFNSQLSVMVTLQPGQLAVLGSTPCGTHDSVFVVELVE